ncbi:hypothetical protein HELRODRAFT_85816, partial [Helobdella robusta]|uniref:Calpain catalytic domain-containing protein n=1 Tax=Helobdella robusta TaxID=6412 RepID=T1G630_HELRO
TYDEVKAECLENRSLFEDPDFPAIDSSAFLTVSKQEKFEWLRPKDILLRSGNDAKPKFISQNATRFDIKQGALSDCWLLAAMATLTQFPKLFDVVVPPNQSFDKDYAGIFKFNFWVFGDWMEVYVDDRIPTIDGEVVFVQSSDDTEFWSALFEKAYAKLVGSYEAMECGLMGEAFEDFTGGIAEMFDHAAKPQKNLLGIMMKAYERSSLMACAATASGLPPMGSILPNGLVTVHAYSITCVRMMPIQQPNGEIVEVPMIRLRNPWGTEHEWNGKWSDKSEEWRSISDEVKKEIGLVVNDDGEFWMDFKDYSANFNSLEICHLSPDCLEDKDPLTGEPVKKWCVNRLDGCWRKKLNAGGSLECSPGSFWINPQYHFEVTDSDENDDKQEGTVIIALMQKDRRRLTSENLELLAIGFVVYKVSLEKNDCVNLIDWSRAYVCEREICVRLKLEPGHYCLIPSTFDVGEEGDFLIRIFSEKPVPSVQIDDKTAIKKCDDLATMSLRLAFEKLTGVEKEMNVYQFQNLLKSVFKNGEQQFEGFSMDTCQSLLASKDRDISGKLSFHELKLLWDNIKIWKVAFDAHDSDKNGSFNSYELRNALYYLGISVSQNTLNALLQRFSRNDDRIHLDEFMHLMARITIMFGQSLI